MIFSALFIYHFPTKGRHIFIESYGDETVMCLYIKCPIMLSKDDVTLEKNSASAN